MQNNQLINIGFDSTVPVNRIVSIVGSGSDPIDPTKRIIVDAIDRGQLIDATCGFSILSVIITDSNHVILSPIESNVLAYRFAIQES